MMRQLKICILSILLLWSMGAIGESQGEPVQGARHILILHSYHQGYEWTDSVQKGIIEKLKLNPEDTLYVEYLDALRNRNPEYLNAMVALYDLKYGDVSMDLVLVSDDAALNFIKGHPELFPKVPVAFCGINNYDPGNFKEISGITGVNEGLSIVETLESAMNLRPQAQKIAVVSGSASTEVRNLEIFRNEVRKLDIAPQLNYLTSLEPEPLALALKEYTAEDIVIYLGYMATPSGKSLSARESVAMIQAATPAPIFGYWDFLLPYGVLGGRVVHGISQGESLGEIANRILAGEPSASIPVVMKSPNKCVYNGELLKVYGISPVSLPPKALIINRPVSDIMANWDTVSKNTFFGYEMFEMHGEMMWLLDPESGIILDANDAALTKYKYENLIGMKVSEINRLTPEALQTVLGEIKDKKRNTLNFKHYLGDGSIIDVEITSYPVTVGGRTVLFSIIHDVTKSLQAQRDVERLNQTVLASMVTILLMMGIALIYFVLNTRKRKQLQIALYKEKEAAEAADKAKSRFLANMSHEIRTPMNGFMGMIQLMQMTDLTEEQKHFMETAKRSGEGLLTVVNDILDYSKIEAGKMQLVMKPISITNLLEDVKALFLPACTLKGLTLNCKWEESIPPGCMGDEFRLKQILSNLVGNAVKFTEQGEISISVRSLVGDPGTHQLEFTVEDTGMGIAEDQLKLIFDRFSQADETSTRIFGGTGLGLAISKSLVSLMGGEIWAESVEGQGSRFSFTCQLEGCGTHHPEVVEDATGSFAAPEMTASLQRKILLGEDDEVSQLVIKGMFNRLGWEVIIASNGEDVVTQSACQEVDLILMDIQMPVMDGYQAAKCIRDQEKPGSHTPILALTAYATPEDEARALASGMDGYISKPVQLKELKEQIQLWCSIK